MTLISGEISKQFFRNTENIVSVAREKTNIGKSFVY